MKPSKRLMIPLACFLLLTIAFAGCLGGDDGNGEEEDTSDMAGEMIITQEDLPSGWYAFNWTSIYGVDYPITWEDESGSFAISYFSDNEDVWNSTQRLIVALLDFDNTDAANSWYDEMREQHETIGNTQDMDVGDEGFYIDFNNDRTDVRMIFRNGDVCVMINYLSNDPSSLSEIIDIAELQNSKL